MSSFNYILALLIWLLHCVDDCKSCLSSVHGKMKLKKPKQKAKGEGDQDVSYLCIIIKHLYLVLIHYDMLSWTQMVFGVMGP